ncbi:hypothetical protein PIROE2DRAFT_15623 [Piromyces sp. E2]|nr:hypothetical protein PIROE2DRAFT_15623 [Piromyces sp. E2]|eukprot:OUM58985.1 hypothetical protein PIROE2DRAFT_15623 [Piromyces sp. E2]
MCIGSINEIINKYDDDINSITKTYDIGERKDHILDIFMFSMETLIQDRQSYSAGLCEGRLNEKINELEKIQESIYEGNFGLESSVKMDILDDIFVSHQCLNLDMEWCEEVEENIEYGNLMSQ